MDEGVSKVGQGDESKVVHNTDDFWCNPREGEFYVVLRVEATIHEPVRAESAEEARAKVEAMIEANELDVCGTDIDDARIDYIHAERPMYLVYRPGTNVNGSSRIEPGDEPREPKDDYERRTYTKPPAARVADSRADSPSGYEGEAGVNQ